MWKLCQRQIKVNLMLNLLNAGMPYQVQGRKMISVTDSSITTTYSCIRKPSTKRQRSNDVLDIIRIWASSRNHLEKPGVCIMLWIKINDLWTIWNQYVRVFSIIIWIYLWGRIFSLYFFTPGGKLNFFLFIPFSPCLKRNLKS